MNKTAGVNYELHFGHTPEMQEKMIEIMKNIQTQLEVARISFQVLDYYALRVFYPDGTGDYTHLQVENNYETCIEGKLQDFSRWMNRVGYGSY